MKHALLDRKIAGIIRWLERLEKSYMSGSIQSALMDAECARADLEDLRQDMWAKVQPKEISQHRILHGVMSFLRPVILAAIIIFAAVAPLAKDVALPLPEPIAEITIDENIVLAEPVIIAAQKEQEKEIPQEAPKQEAPKKIAKKSTLPTKRASVTPAPKAPVVKSVPYDKVFSLMQTGERALKNNSTIKFQ